MFDSFQHSTIIVFFLVSLLQDQRLETLKWPLSEQLIVRCAQLLLALPAVDPSPVDGLMDFCAATQLPPGEGEINDVPAEVSAQNALLRGSLWAEIAGFCFRLCYATYFDSRSRKDGTARQVFNIRCHWYVPTWFSTSNKSKKNTDYHYSKSTERQGGV